MEKVFYEKDFLSCTPFSCEREYFLRTHSMWDFLSFKWSGEKYGKISGCMDYFQLTFCKGGFHSLGVMTSGFILLVAGNH